MFTKEEKGTFKYHFAHWCAFQMTALNLKVWKPHMLFHDWYKPWLNLFCNKNTVKQYHRTHSRHHIEYMLAHPNKVDKINWLDMVIDWECSRFTKADAQLRASSTLGKMLMKYDPSKVEDENKQVEYAKVVTALNQNILPLLYELKLYNYFP